MIALTPTRKRTSGKILGYLLIALIFGFAIKLRFDLPQWPLIAPDSYAYLTPALTGHLADIGPRTFVYPLFCSTVLNLWGSVPSLAIAQHLLGLLGPALLLTGWIRLGRTLWIAPPARAAHFCIGLITVAFLLFSSTAIYYETAALLEGFHAFFQCALVATFCFAGAQIARAPAARRVLLPACVIAALGVVMYFVNPRWGAAAPATVLLALAAAFADPRRTRALTAVIGTTLITALIFGVPQAKLSAAQPWNRTFIAKHLLFMHADLAVVEFRRELAGPVPPPQTALLHLLADQIDAESARFRREGTAGWNTLTFNPDRLLYSAGSADSILLHHFARDPDGYAQFCRHYYGLILRNQTGAYASKIIRELTCFYAGPGGALIDYDVPLGAEWAATAPRLADLATRGAPGKLRRGFEHAATEVGTLASSPQKIRSPLWLRYAADIANRVFLVVTLSALTACLLVLLVPKLRCQPILAVSANLVAAAILVLFAQIFTLSAVTISGNRYTGAVRTLAVFSLATSCVLLFVLAGTLIAHLARRWSKADSASLSQTFQTGP